jgi:23S rRNA (guanine2445-N2)-methyltransferase / 23S rRNA (guanine2069-N7)-methyltransferase
VLRRRFAGWQAAVLVADQDLARALRLPSPHAAPLFNGTLPCTLLTARIPATRHRAPMRVAADRAARDRAALERAERGTPAAADAPPLVTADPTEFANRLRRNVRHLGRTMRRSGVTCYRVYDADLPDYALAIDLYEGLAHVQEYAPPAGIDATKAAARLAAALAVAPGIIGVSPENVFLKTRRRQRGTGQYARLADARRFHTVHEDAAAYLVNLTDYLDTGLFLDQRLTRRLIRDLAAGRPFLDLFGYTGTATVSAALGGSPGSLTVDLSETYLEWARRNFALNGLDQREHRTERADCLEWLRRPHAQRYGLVFLDPPTFSNSKRMRAAVLDVQRDHVALVHSAARLLEPDGVLLFSANAHRFRLDIEALAAYDVVDLSRRTLPPDFLRRQRMHHLWRISRTA